LNGYYEFWLLSTLEKGVTRFVAIEEEKDEFKRAMNTNHSFITRWGDLEYNTLNPRYFVFPDSVSGYIRY